MILIEKGQLRFLLAGRPIEVDVTREHRKHRAYAVGIRHNRTLCHIEVTAIEKLPAGWKLTIRKLTGDQVRLFSRSGGYVTAPVEANPDDPDVLRGADFHEPEAVDEETQEQLTELGTLRWRQEHALRESERATVALHERLAALERETKRPGAPDLSKQMRVVRQRIDRLHARLQKQLDDLSESA